MENPLLGRARHAHRVDKKPVNTTGYNHSVNRSIWNKRFYSKEIFRANSKITLQAGVWVRCPALWQIVLFYEEKYLLCNGNLKK